VPDEYDSETELEDEEGCEWPYPEHEWQSGDLQCRRCGADLSEWNEDDDEA
jgi:hypothetical protein